MNSIARDSLLFDCYGELLTEKKRKVMHLYQEENLSLSEIAQEPGVSRAAVHDSLKHARASLESYENTLGMVEDIEKRSGILKDILSSIEDLKAARAEDRELTKALEKMEKKISGLERE